MRKGSDKASLFHANTCRAKVESMNALETYLYNLKTSYEDSLKDKIGEDDLEELKTSVEAGLEVS